MKPFLFETMDMIDTNPKKYIGPPVDPKTGKFKCSKHGKEDSCFDDTEVHTSEIPDEKVFFKPKEKKSMKENDSLFNDEDFEILEADHKKYPEGSGRKFLAQINARERKDIHKGLKNPPNAIWDVPEKTAKGYAKSASSAGRKEGKGNQADYSTAKYDAWSSRHDARMALSVGNPMRSKKKGDLETLTRGAVKEAVVSEADHKKYPEGSPEKRKAQSKSLQNKIVHKYIKNGEHEATKQAVKYASQHGRAGNKYYRMFGKGERWNGSVGSFAADHARTWAVSALDKSPNRPKKKGDVETLTRGAFEESRSFNDFLNRDIEESETPAPQEKKFNHNNAILKWELEAVGIRTKNAPIVENPTPKVDYDEVAKSIFEKHVAKAVPITVPTKFQEAIEKREKKNVTLTKAFYDEYK